MKRSDNSSEKPRNSATTDRQRRGAAKSAGTILTYRVRTPGKGGESGPILRFPLPSKSPLHNRPFIVTALPSEPFDDPTLAPVNELLPAAIRKTPREKSPNLLVSRRNELDATPTFRVLVGDAAKVLSWGYGREVRLLPSGEVVSPHVAAIRSLHEGTMEDVPFSTLATARVKDRRHPAPGIRKSYREAMDAILDRINQSDRQSRGSFFEVANDSTGRWDLIPGGSESWTGGFWVGMVWNAWSFTGNPVYRDMAERWNTRLLGRERRQHHDTGFINFCASAKAYELTHDQRYLQGAVAGADRLREMFNRRTNLIPAWEVGGEQTIIDTMMNLQILWWAHRQTGREVYAEIGIRHARRAMEILVREDGSCHQSIFYDPNTGVLKYWNTHQGYNAVSAWARGIAWALYGYSVAYRYTKIPEFLTTARKVAGFVEANMPEDGVPWNDYRDPGIVFSNKDTSAAAINACGFFHLADIVPSHTEASHYRRLGKWIVENVIDKYLTPVSRESKTPPGVLQHGCYRRPGRHEVIWGDYYLMEALMSLLAHHVKR